MTKQIFGWVLMVAMSVGAFAQSDGLSAKKKGYVTVDEVPTVSLAAGKTANVEVRFRVRPGYHVNSNHPGSELLIPTEIEFARGDKISAGKIVYPAGEELALAFDPKDKLNVYTGDVAVVVPVIAAKDAKAGSYHLKGELHYQACNDNSCFPPKSVVVEITVIIKNTSK